MQRDETLFGRYSRDPKSETSRVNDEKEKSRPFRKNVVLHNPHPKKSEQ